MAAVRRTSGVMENPVYGVWIRLNQENVEDYVDECYTVNTYKKVYSHTIMPMSGPNLWPQSERVAPIPPPIVERKAGRIRKLRRVNPIEAEDNGKKKVCKVRKYLCKTCGLPGHNSRVCKKKDNQAGADPGQQSMDEDSHVPPLKTRISQRSNYIATGIRLQPRVHVGAVGIRAPPPMASPSMQYVPFALPARTRTAPVFFKAGQKFINLKDVEKQ